VRRLTWRLVPFLFLLYIVAYRIASTSGLRRSRCAQQLGFTDAVYGLGAGMFFRGISAFRCPVILCCSGGGPAVDCVADDGLGSDFVGDGTGQWARSF